MNTMDRETVLSHSKAIRIEHTLLPEFVELLKEYCTIMGKGEYADNAIYLLQIPMVNTQVIEYVLNYFEAKYNIIKIEDINTKQLLNIY